MLELGTVARTRKLEVDTLSAQLEKTMRELGVSVAHGETLEEKLAGLINGFDAERF